jgi:hypothetical protein
MINGIHQPNQELVVISDDFAKIIASTRANSQGDFTLEIPAEYSNQQVHLLAKIKSPESIGIEYRAFIPSRTKAPLKIDFNQSNLSRLDYSLVPVTSPDRPVNLFLDIKSISGIPPELEKFFNWSSPTSKSSYFFRWTTNHLEGSILVPQGNCLIGGDQGNPDQPFAGPNTSVIQAEKLPECIKLLGEPLLGFELEISETTTIELRLE